LTITAVDPNFEPDERWIPVERRWLGIDRRSIVPAAIALAVALVTIFVLPFVDDEVRYHDPVVAGDVMALEGDITFVPEPGWGIEAGVRARSPLAGGAYPGKAVVVQGDSTFAVQADSFNGDAGDLLDTVEGQIALPAGFLSKSDRQSITNVSGDTGVIEVLLGTDWQGALVTYVFNGVGVVALLLGPTNMPDNEVDMFSRMVASIQQVGGATA
jgi:hypothetical protein